MSVIDSMLGVIAPHDCLVCGTEGVIICSSCQTEHIPSPPSRCAHCLRLSTSSALCDTAKRTFRMQHVWVASEYERVAKSLVGKLKFDAVRESAKIMASLIADTLPYLPPDTIVSPVPTITSHQRKRGFDHTRLIAREVARLKSCSYELLLSRLDQRSQVGSRRQERQLQLTEQMYALNPKFVSKQKILLIDDVFTTGATLKEAARALREAGALHVDAAVFAQKIL